VHGLLELLLVEELEDEEDELAAERRHGCGRPFRGRSARSPREGGWRLRRPRILGFRGSSPPLSAREKRGDVEEGREERKSSLAFLDALQTSRPFLSPHGTPTVR
jgi:hypothetical protein